MTQSVQPNCARLSQFADLIDVALWEIMQNYGVIKKFFVHGVG